MTHPNYLPEGFHTVNPYLIVADSAKLIDFLKVVFDAVEVVRVPDEHGAIKHAEMRIGDSPIEMADARSDWPATSAALHVYVPDVDAVYLRALSAGAEVLQEPQDQFYGERSASVRDASGIVWHIATKTEDLTLAEMQRRAAEQAHQA